MESKIFLFGLLLLASACSPSYQQRNRNRLHADSTRNSPNQGHPRPFRFAYNKKDDFGNTNYHEAQGDDKGKVQGKYGYTDVDGVYRQVEYEADGNGYRATILTNEPGTGKRKPADVIFAVEPVPQTVVRKYNSKLPPSSPPSARLPLGGLHTRIGYGPPVEPA